MYTRTTNLILFAKTYKIKTVILNGIRIGSLSTEYVTKTNNETKIHK